MALAVATRPQQDFQGLVLSCNKDGMDSLRKGQLKAAFEQFKYAESVLIANQTDGDNTSLLAVTCNNLGCYYKKTGKLHGALSYLRRALRMEVDLETDEVTLAGTHLNICAILSKLEKHDKAVQHAVCALELIDRRVQTADPKDLSQDDYSVLAIAYHNVAMERDFLREYDKALSAFQQGYQVAKRCLGEEHPLTMTLGSNCSTILQKSKKLSHMPPVAVASQRPFTKELSPSTLPNISAPQASPRPKDVPPMPQNNLRQEAANWAATESAAWSSFAHKTLSGDVGPHGPRPPQGAPSVPLPPRREEERPVVASPQLSARAIRDAQSHDLTVPPFRDSYQDIPFGTASLKSPFLRKTPLIKSIDASPEALMDIVDSDNANRMVTAARVAPHDYRPNRVIKGATRTAKVVRRTGLHNSTKHRDLVMAGRLVNATDASKTAYQRKVAAERIQRVWRSWYKYCQENHDWMTTTWVAATMIQAKWRSYHVRRMKLDRAARSIQRHIRGHLVRRILRKHKAAVAIQRHVVGMLTRNQLRTLQRAATKVGALARGAAARRRARWKREHLTATALTIQCATRQFIARRVAGEKREVRDLARTRWRAAVNLQRLFRGFLGRRRADAARREYLKNLQEYQAATKLQAMARRDRAIKRVDRIRAEELDKMCRAATFVRKMWIGHRYQRKYQQLMREFAEHEAYVITIQRYARGFLVRLRMWREAIRAEEELWAAMEIQRIYRGYVGRVRFEDKYEQLWCREMSAAMIQRNLRGWLARVRIGRARRAIARAEFERARQRFKSSQRIQALSRGVLTRKITSRSRQRKLAAVVHVQRMWRGYTLRRRLWQQVIELRATMIQAAVRGFLTRNRRFHLVAITIAIQRSWRRWRTKPYSVRAAAMDERQRRKEKASIIQENFRKHQESRHVERIHRRG
eukprot:TRINITY_DN32517_c0_g1_i1.p1 TRINITY_DN32517_c0_g1~~TRINITY_DN32517_c0_g1_i1.p1  ORF type:complete len:922 (+),score=104.41 TRINITY_DN32517_c0_g1_i1:69-2834(+)